MFKQKKIMIFLISILLTSFLFSAVFASDIYGNHITSVTVKQKEAGSWIVKDTTTNDTYIQGYNVTVENDQNLMFYANSKLNSTWCSEYGNITSYSALALQIFDDVSYAQPMTIILPAYQTGGFWIMSYLTAEIENNLIANSTACNVTQWVDYQNGSGWLLIEEWEFNLVTSITTPPTVTGTELQMSIFYFWSFIITLFGSTLFGVLAMKGGGAKAFIICLFCIMFSITFYSMLASSML